jgi:hypothetical protein
MTVANSTLEINARIANSTAFYHEGHEGGTKDTKGGIGQN